jgi:hypothetical protein
MKDDYITAFDDLAGIKLNDNPPTVSGVGNSDPPRRAPYEEDRFLGLDGGAIVHFNSLPQRP